MEYLPFQSIRGWQARRTKSAYTAHFFGKLHVRSQRCYRFAHSITYRIATGPRQGRKVLTLQTLPAIDEPPDIGVGNVAGFSLHAGVAAKANERHKLERLCRYITRPAVSEKRLSLTAHGQVRYSLKTPWNDGTTHVIFERGGHPPLDFMARLAALVPRPRVNLTRLDAEHPVPYPAGNLWLFKFIPDEFVTVCSPLTVSTGR